MEVIKRRVDRWTKKRWGKREVGKKRRVEGGEQKGMRLRETHPPMFMVV
jgi:hypothetical protein